MRIYFEQRELFYIEVDADNYEEALAEAVSKSNDDMFWEEADETGQIEVHWCSEEINAMLQD